MVAFDKIIGYEDVKRQLRQVADMISDYEKYERLGAKMPKGILLYGVPGVGKTMLAMALIEEVDIPTKVIRHTMERASFIEHIKGSFAEAAEHPRAIVLLDDLDKFSMDEKNGEEFAVVQACIDEVKDRNVFVIATANSLRDLPESLLRSGRFDRKIKVGIPEGENAVNIITHYMSGVKTEAAINYEDIAKMLTGKSCATLERVINEAAIEAAFEGKEEIGMAHFVKATLSDVYGVESCCAKLSDEQREEIAYHEAGHAVIAEVLIPGDVGLVSLASDLFSSMGGFTLRCRKPERRAYEILVALGGKAACEMQYGKVASGTGHDLMSACRHLSTSIGDVGSAGLSLLDCIPDNDSETILRDRESAIFAELQRYLFKAKEIIAQNREFLQKVATELLEKETLLYSDMRRIRESCTITPAMVG